MKAIDFYYQIKPAIPRWLQIGLRRMIAAQKRKVNADTWPINPSAAKQPDGWTGWPDNKRFALILQHDVDSITGLKRCVRLADMEKQHNFRSSFNFVPEDYPTPPTLMRKLVASGFEVGVHGLRHDGKLFRRPDEFCAKIPRINHYLRKWGAVGFTSPSMLRKLTWIAELDIEHSCSTFDTDPFEPQSDGINSIFPFLASNETKSRTYVELPYTLPQDHGLFVILKEKDIRIWKQKIDWIAENGGMAALNTHPDYMNFDGTSRAREEYPVGYYLEFLEYVREKYAGQYWHVLPREMAQFWRKTVSVDRQADPPAKKAKSLPQAGLRQRNQGPVTPRVKIWIDLDNTPHVPFFIPIIRELERSGHEVVLTARDAFQVCDLAEEKGLRFRKVVRHYGKNPVMKITGLVLRSFQLLPFCLRQRPGLSLSHGARSQNLISNLLGIPTVLIADYEHARTAPFTHPRWTIVPEALSPEGLPSKISHVRYYRGIKEDVYAAEFKPTSSLMEELGLRDDELIVTVRPPANEAHYYNPESDVLFVELMSRVCQSPGVRAVLLPRNHQQELSLRTKFPGWFKDARTVVPARAVDGLSLLWVSDFVVSGGGTMNREAAALGIPVYSIFRGKAGAVDLMLEQQGRLKMIHDTEDVWSKIRFVRRDKSRLLNNQPRAALQDIIDNIENIIAMEKLPSRNKEKIRQG
jgi:predicted glycosyltransferase/peptidoglycan/xylan/chitin deacetylase (PgdA/CDA1 family)